MKLYLRNGTWWVTFGSGGSRVRKSTGETDYDAAQAAARRMTAPLHLETQAERIEAAARSAGRLREKAAESRASSHTWESAWQAFAATESARGGERAPATMRTYRTQWDRFAAAMKARHFDRPCTVTAAAAAEWLATRGQCSRFLAHVAITLAFRAAGIPPLGVPAPRWNPAHARHREPLTAEQVAALLAAARGTPYHTLVLILAYTGMRLGDAATLTVEQVDFEEGAICRRAHKTGAELRLPIHPALLDELRRAIPADAAPGAFVLPRLAASYAKNYQSISARIAALMATAGIPKVPRVYCTHCLRTTFASICAENGVPLGVIQEWLGHASQEVTRIYARIENMRAKRAALAKLPDFTAARGEKSRPARRAFSRAPGNDGRTGRQK